jgi:hypothetical protein
VSIIKLYGENTVENCLYVRKGNSSLRLLSIDKATLKLSPTNIPIEVDDVTALSKTSIYAISNSNILNCDNSLQTP